jgi:hypothetical protein
MIIANDHRSMKSMCKSCRRLSLGLVRSGLKVATDTAEHLWMGAHRMRADWPQFKKDQLVSCGGQTWDGEAFLRRTKCFGERILFVTGLGVGAAIKPGPSTS